MGPEPVATRVVEGVSYTSYDMAPGLLMFSCVRLGAVMSTGGCEKRWREAQAPSKRRILDKDGNDLSPQGLDICRRCPVGAVHSGETPVHFSRLFGSDICPRCRKGATRMIGDRVCVNCYNRERERMAGRNARGNAPSRLVPLRTVQYRVMVNGGSHLVRADRVVDMLEPMVQTFRKASGEPTFAFAGLTHGLRQGQLFHHLPVRRPTAAQSAGAVRRRLRAFDQGVLF